MSIKLQQDLDQIKRDLLYLGSMAKDSVEKSLVAVIGANENLAREVIDDDEAIDRKEVQIEKKCLEILALMQPVAQDLRFITSVMKINSDLERMGDSAVSIARRTIHFAKRERIEMPKDLKRMSELAIEMVLGSLQALIHQNATEAKQIRDKDKGVDDLQGAMFKYVKEQILKNPQAVSVWLDVFTITHRIERIADLATNICEEVIYMVEGTIVRHQK